MSKRETAFVSFMFGAMLTAGVLLWLVEEQLLR